MAALKEFVLLLSGGICLLALVVTATRFFAVFRIRNWAQAEGKILTSETRRCRVGESGPETRPHILYEYTTGGKTHCSHQLKPRGIPMGELDLPHFLGRYPVGASAQVYYNPANPSEAVLERESLWLTGERLGCVALFAAAVALGLAFGLKPLHGLVERWFPNTENEGVLVVTTALGVYLILFGLMWIRQGVTERLWPTVTGTVVSSAVGSFRTAGGGAKVAARMFQATVFYEYEAGGRRYRSSQIRREKISGSEGLANGVVEKYPAGSQVLVHYNPSNPADAVLETSATLGFVVLWAMALLMFAVAASVSGYFRHR